MSELSETVQEGTTVVTVELSATVIVHARGKLATGIPAEQRTHLEQKVCRDIDRDTPVSPIAVDTAGLLASDIRS